MRAWWVVLWLAAPANALEVWAFPSAPLGGDGEHLVAIYALDGEALTAPTVRARDGQVVDAKAAPDGGWLVRYRAPRVTALATDVLTVTTRRGTGKVDIAVEPVGRVQLAVTISPSPLLLEKGARAEVRIRARDAAGRPARSPLRLGASVGRVSAPEEVGPGEYRAVYTPPEEKFPQVAIVAALSVADGAFASAACALAARVTVTGQGEPGASLAIAVDNRTFGPLSIGKDGRWALPLIVPPGSRAIGVSTDKMGNQQKRDIDLHLPPFPKLLLFAVPSELPADGRAQAEIVAFSVDARGNPEKRAPPALTADRGNLSQPEVHGDGSTTWTFTAPSSMGPGKAGLRAGGASAAVTLRPAPPLAIQVVQPPQPLPAGSDAPVSVEVRVRDAGGAPVSGAELTATLAGGRVVTTSEKAPGRYAVELVPPRDPGRGSATLHVEVSGMRPGAPRRVTLHPAKASAGHVAAEAWVDDDLGLPVPGVKVELEGPGGAATAESDRFGTARLEVARPTGRHFRFSARLPSLPGMTATLDELSVGGTLHTVSGLAGRGVEPEREPPAESSGEGDLPLVAAAPMDVRLSVEPDGRGARLRVKLVDSAGKPVTGQILYQASAGTLTLLRPVAGGEAELRFIPPPGAKKGQRFLVSVTETRTRVTAFTEVTPP
jgi:Carboxypeptidase regulatory-like domain